MKAENCETSESIQEKECETIVTDSHKVLHRPKSLLFSGCLSQTCGSRRIRRCLVDIGTLSRLNISLNPPNRNYNVTLKLAARITLDALGMTVPCKMIRSSTFVASL